MSRGRELFDLAAYTMQVDGVSFVTLKTSAHFTANVTPEGHPRLHKIHVAVDFVC